MQQQKDNESPMFEVQDKRRKKPYIHSKQSVQYAGNNVKVTNTATIFQALVKYHT